MTTLEARHVLVSDLPRWIAAGWRECARPTRRRHGLPVCPIPGATSVESTMVVRVVAPERIGA